VIAKNPMEVLSTHRYYLLRPSEQRGQAQQWISITIHEHGKIYAVAKEEYQLMTHIYTNQALMQLGAPVSALSNQEEDNKMKDELLGRMHRRKNSINKYYEINAIMITRFMNAQR
jgi:hypothetical protein